MSPLQTQQLLDGYVAYTTPSDLAEYTLQGSSMDHVGTSVSLSATLSLSVSWSWSWTWT